MLVAMCWTCQWDRFRSDCHEPRHDNEEYFPKDLLEAKHLIIKKEIAFDLLSLWVGSDGNGDVRSTTWINSINELIVNSSDKSSVDRGLGRLVGLIICSSIHARPEKP